MLADRFKLHCESDLLTLLSRDLTSHLTPLHSSAPSRPHISAMSAIFALADSWRYCRARTSNFRIRYDRISEFIIVKPSFLSLRSLCSVNQLRISKLCM